MNRDGLSRAHPLEIESAQGLVRIEAKAGALIHDPPTDPAKWFQGAKSGTLTSTVFGVGIGITNEREGQGVKLQPDGVVAELEA